MIGVVCLNPALDVTHHVPAVDWSGVNRPAAVHARPGGKGLNVARTLHTLGAEVLVMGLIGGTTGESVTAELAALAVPAAFTWVRGETRRTFTVVDGQTGHAALFSEPGPLITEDGYAEFRVRYASSLGGCAAVVLSGSLPPGLPPGSYAELITMASAAGVPVLMDAHGEALRLGAAAGPAIVKPNLAELETFAGRPCLGGAGRAGVDRRAVAAAAGELRAAGPRRSSCRSAATGCSPTPATAAGRRSLQPWWPGTRPGPGTPRPRAWSTAWPGAIRGRNGCGARSRWERRWPWPRWPGNSARRTTRPCGPGSR